MDKFSALADPTRRSILEMLAKDKALSATEIASRFAVSPPAISQPLKILGEAELVRMEKRAQQRIYRINPSAVREVEDWTAQMLRLWNERFDALDELLEAENQEDQSNQTGKEESDDD
jgi:DNA-binding transcriptional ArsR family regulator